MRLLSFGEVLWDVLGDTAHLGGAPLNLAVHAARCGFEAAVVSAVGNDPRGAEARAAAAAAGVETGWIQTRADRPTGRVDVRVSATGQPSYVIREAVAYDHIDLADTDLEALAAWKPAVLCYGSLAQRASQSRASLTRLRAHLQGQGTLTCCDVNLRQSYYDREVIRDSLTGCAILKCNDEELPVLLDLLGLTQASDPGTGAATLARAYDLATVLVTRGARGAGVFTRGGYHSVPGLPVSVADTVGAGDAFTAAFLAAHLRGRDPVTSLALANRVGAYVAGRSGALPPYDDDLRATLSTPEKDLPPCP